MTERLSSGAPGQPEDNYSNHLQYPRPSDGKLVPLVTQSFEDPHNLPETSRWTRLGRPVSQVPSLLLVSNWIGAPILKVGTVKRVYTWKAVGEVVLRLIIAWPLVCILVTGVEFLKPNTSSHYNLPHFGGPGPGQPAALPSESSQTSYLIPVASSLEDPGTQGRQSYLDDIRLSSSPAPPISHHIESTYQYHSSGQSLRPRYLCFVEGFGQRSFKTRKVSDFIEEHGDHVDIEFVFISYTRLQFRVATNEELDAYDYSSEEERDANKQVAQQDRRTLIQWGIDAAKAAGKQAFWLDFECVRNDDGIARSTSSSDDVYRICDIVRAAHSMVIAIGPPASDKVAAILAGHGSPTFSPESVTTWLRQWGSRLWTLPELLLCPSEYRIKLFVLDDPAEPKALAKRNFAERAWEDAAAVKELVDHYEGSAVLTQLNLIETALACFSRRKTDQFSQGDIAYAIMGLLPHRHRPSVNQSDTGFQAFARLSLANDGEFLERLICLLPPGNNAPWYDTRDQWHANPSDIHPSTQVSRALDADILVLEGVQGAFIQWDNVEALSSSIGIQNSILALVFVQFYLICAIIPKFFSIPFMVLRTFDKHAALVFVFFGYGLGAIVAVFALVAPSILVFSRRTNNQPNQARLIGFEGFVSTGDIEKHLSGFNHGSLSLISATQGYADATASESSTRPEGHPFTLVDTWTKTVTHFRCSLPPVAMFICGHEAGMQRALLCSYDWKTRAFCRQTVLRVATRVLDQMRRVERIRLSLSSNPNPHAASAAGPGLSPRLRPVAGSRSEAEPDALSQSDSTLFVYKYPRSRMATVVFLSVLTLALGTDALALADDPKAYPFRKLLYYTSFMVAQWPAYILLNRFSMNRVFPWIAMMKGWCRVIDYRGSLILRYMDIATLCSLGAVDGLLLAVLVDLTWSWYSSETLPYRLLLWAVIARQAMVSVELLCSRYLVAFPVYFDLAGSLLLVMLCFCLGTLCSSIVGRPKEVSWLESHQKIWFARRAATGRFDQVSSGVSWLQVKLWSAYKKYMNLLLVFIISLLSSLDSGITGLIRPGLDASLMLGTIVLEVVVAAIIYRAPTVSIRVAMCCFTLSIFGTFLSGITPRKAVLGMLARLCMPLNVVVLPVLWAAIVSNASTRVIAIRSLVASLVGTSVGGIDLASIHSLGKTTSLITCLVISCSLLAFLWVYDHLYNHKPSKSPGDESQDTNSGADMAA